MNALHYLLQANLYLVLFYGFYRVLLRGETFHQLNRTYLLAAAAMSLFIPVLQSDWVRSWFVTTQVHEAVYTFYDPQAVFVTVLPQQAAGLTWGDAFAFVYLAGVLVGLGRFGIQLAHLQRYLTRRRNANGRAAYSFFNHLVVGRHLDGRDMILVHEQVHARQLHSADVLLMELLAIFNWFNPVVYAYRASLRAVHEFIADQQASRHAPTPADYALLLFAKQFGVSPQLTNPFFSQSLLRRRVAMLQKTRSSRKALLKYGLTAPLFGAMLVFSSAAVSDSRALKAVAEAVGSDQPVRVIPLPVLPAVPEYPQAKLDLSKAVALSPELKRVMRGDTVEPIIFTVVEKPASFPGGHEALTKFLAQNLKYPENARKANVQGKVFMNFVVEKDGTITDLQVLKGVGYGCDEEAVRVMNAMPKWVPGQQSGRAVRSRFNIPITFTLDGKPLPNANSRKMVEIWVKGKETGSAVLALVDNMPLIVNNGRIIYFDTNKNQKIEVNDFQFLSIDVAKARYGDLGKNGAILLTTDASQLPPAQKHELGDFGRVAIVSTDRTLEAVRQDTIDPLFTVVERPAQFPGGNRKLNKYFASTLRYPEEARKANVEGKVFVTFIVEKDGTITNAQVLKGIGYGCDEEALRAMNAMPKWTPGQQSGRVVRSRFNIPIGFSR